VGQIPGDFFSTTLTGIWPYRFRPIVIGRNSASGPDAFKQRDVTARAFADLYRAERRVPARVQRRLHCACASSWLKVDCAWSACRVHVAAFRSARIPVLAAASKSRRAWPNAASYREELFLWASALGLGLRVGAALTGAD
jgi:hypothetical protein